MSMQIMQGGAVGIVRSLNLGQRRREIERIEAENHAFAKRLFDKQPNLQKSSLEEEYRAHLRFKKQIQKVPEVQISQ